MNLKNNIRIEQQKQMRVLYIATLLLLLPIFGFVYFFFGRPAMPESVAQYQESSIQPLSVDLQSVSTTAHSALVVSLNTQEVFYQKFPDKQLPLASIVKLVMVKVADEQALHEMVNIDKSEPIYGDVQLSLGEKWNKDDLITYTLLTSSNDGARSLAANTKSARSFVDRMNSLASTIGLLDTAFYNETGLDDDLGGVPGSKGTAQDVTKLLSYLIKNDLGLYEQTKYNSVPVNSPYGITQATNTNAVTGQITGLLLSKTGYTDLAGGNLAVVADMGLNEPTAFVVLHSSKESRFDDVLALQSEYFAQVAESMR